MHSFTGFDYNMWPAAILSIGLVFFFIGSYMLPTRRREWRSMGLFAAWIVALFTEMYGIPLTIYALTALLGRAYPVLNPFTHQNGHLLVALAGGSQIVWGIVIWPRFFFGATSAWPGEKRRRWKHCLVRLIAPTKNKYQPSFLAGKIGYQTHPRLVTNLFDQGVFQMSRTRARVMSDK